MSPFELVRSLALVAVTTVMLSACGGGGGSDDAAQPPASGGAGGGSTPPAAITVDITGLAATGAPIAMATVSAVNARGETATAQSDANGRFTIKVGEGGPYLLSVADAVGKVWYSYAQAAGAANISPLTTLALLQANGNRSLADLAAGWSSRQVTPEQVLEAAKLVNANLTSVMQANGVAAASTNVFTAEFSANGRGLDGVLDAMRVAINCTANGCTQIISTPAGSTLVSWNGSLSTGGFTFSWTSTSAGGGSIGGTVDVGIGSCRAPQAGTYSLVVQTTVSGFGSLPIPDICIDGLPAKPESQTEFCGSSTVQQQLPPGVQIVSCSYDGNVGTISARITQPFTIDYSVKYSFIRH